jgi:tRNA (cmo5U34)-methyltransferase
MMRSADPTGMHDWHSGAYVHEWVEAQRDDERAVRLRRMMWLIPFDPDAEVRVLDIGGGYGFVTRLVLETFPRAHVVLHDYSEPMIAEAKMQLAEFGDAVSFARGDLMTPDWVENLDGQFDAVVSSIAIHNVRYPDRIHGTYLEVFRYVAPGGCFLNLDRVEAAGQLARDAERHAQVMARRQELFEETGQWRSLAEVEPEVRFRRPRVDHGPEPAVADERLAAHEPATLTNQLRWLKDAGFDEVECFWRDRQQAMLGAFRVGSARVGVA